MALPWIGILDAAIGMANMALARRAKNKAAAEEAPGQPAAASGLAASGTVEAQLAGVVVAALKEVFERDNRRLDLERELAEAERQRAERALRLELRRHAGEREIGRLRLLAGVAVVSWLGALVLPARFPGAGVGGRVILGAGWLLLLAALACAFAGLAGVSRSLAAPDSGRDAPLEPGPAGTVAALLIIVGLGLIGLAQLVG